MSIEELLKIERVCCDYGVHSAKDLRELLEDLLSKIP